MEVILKMIPMKNLKMKMLKYKENIYVMKFFIIDILYRNGQMKLKKNFFGVILFLKNVIQKSMIQIQVFLKLHHHLIKLMKYIKRKKRKK
jgi:hypothetical protein